MEVTVAVLAGGRGSRIGGDKALVSLAGRPLISYPLSAARAAGLPAVVVAKHDTKLPDLDVRVLLEPDDPTHPLLGVITALQAFPAVIALPCDMPFVAPGDLSALAEMDVDVATLAPGQPLPALYRGTMLPQLLAAVEAGASIRSTQAQALLAPATTAAMHPAAMTVVNTLEDLAAAEALISRR
jgi:molybdopterin-guanine dinucleotide biosynthesis protein A